jgi:hypothetical protein
MKIQSAQVCFEHQGRPFMVLLNFVKERACGVCQDFETPRQWYVLFNATPQEVLQHLAEIGVDFSQFPRFPPAWSCLPWWCLSR